MAKSKITQKASFAHEGGGSPQRYLSRNTNKWKKAVPEVCLRYFMRTHRAWLINTRERDAYEYRMVRSIRAKPLI